MDFNRIQAAEVKLWDFSAYFWNIPRTVIKGRSQPTHEHSLIIVSVLAVKIECYDCYSHLLKGQDYKTIMVSF